MSRFPKMVDVVPEASKGCAVIKHIVVPKFACEMAAIRGERLLPGPIAQLFVNGALMMSDGFNEHLTNYEVCHEARGNVLIAGLGIGMILTRILEKENVNSVTVVEKYQDVIDIVSPNFPSPKLNIIQGDIFEWLPTKGMKFDCIYFDIWATQSTDTLEEMAILSKRFRSFRVKGAWLESWNKPALIRRKKNERSFA